MKGVMIRDFDIDIRVERDSGGMISSGLVVSDILRQNQALILVLHKGELKSDPSVGVGLADMLNDNELDRWRAEIREQLEMDGQRVESIHVSSTSINIDAKYR
ncbi:MAG: hypothetical protein ACTTGW_01245 [Candidatus Cryptobacteroides sp.]